jgi:hypothetical protein
MNMNNLKTNTNSNISPKSKQYKWPKTFNGWIDLLTRSEANERPHLFQDFIIWKAYTGGFWGVDWKKFYKKLDVLCTKNIHIPKDILNKEPYQQYTNKATTLANKARNQNWERYTSRLILSIQDAIHINERYLCSLEPPKTETATLMIDGDLGTGKSQWFYKKYIKKAKPQQSIIVIVPRRSLAKIAATSYGIVDYEDAKNDKLIKDISKMSICINSILKLINSDKPIDVLFLDEFDLTIQHLVGNAVPENIREDLIFHFLEIINNAKHVVCAQNLLSDLALFVLEQAGRKNITKVVNNNQPWKNLQVDFFKQKKQAIDRLLEIVENGNPFLCPCNSSGQATNLFLSIKERFPNKNILLLTLDTATKEEQAKFISNPNKQSNQYEGIIFSPVIESGVSLDSDHFHDVIGFCSTGEGVGTPDAFVQMLLRGRKAKRIAVFVEPQRYLLPEQEIDCITEIIARFNLVANNIKRHSGKVVVDFELTEAANLAVKAEVLKNKLKNQASQSVYDLFTKRMGCNVNLIHDSKDIGAGQEVIKEGLKIKKEIFQNKVCNSDKISKSEYDQIHKKRIPSYNESWAIKRYELEKELCVNLDEFDDLKELNELFAFWREGRILNTIHAFETATLSKEHAIAIAEYFMEKKTPDNQDHGFFLQWVIRAGIAKSLQLSYDDGVLLYNPNFRFTYNDLLNESWCDFARENHLAINAANLGARIKTEITKQVLGHWIMGIGIKLKRKRLPVRLDKEHRRRNGCYAIDINAMSYFLAVIKRRYDNKINKYHSLIEQSKSNGFNFKRMDTAERDEIFQDGKLEQLNDFYKLFCKDNPNERKNKNRSQH